MSDGGEAEGATSPPPSPSPPRALMATPVPGSPSPRPAEKNPAHRESHRTAVFNRRPVPPLFQIAWKQDMTTGLVTLDSDLVPSQPPDHTAAANSDDSDNEDERDDGQKAPVRKILHNWRNKERMRTMGVAIALCLNLGTDPPDSDRVAPCARSECGIDPTRYHADASTYTVLKMIGERLEQQFRNLQQRAQIKLAGDPTVDMIRKTCTSLRRLAKGERVLVHFNGHGVPKPTRNGEIWAFNDDFTQYIPLSIFDLIRWAGHPSMFTFDCQSAGQLIPHFQEHDNENERKYRQQLEEWRRNKTKRQKEQERKDRRDRENELLVRMARAPNSLLLAAAGVVTNQSAASQVSNNGHGGAGDIPANNTQPQDEEAKPVRKRIIVLVPCGADEALPSSPHLPADLFTCCLTLPIQTALRWFILQNRATMEPLGIDQDIVDLIPGKLTERKTMLGELNWVFTAVTDTIAWSVLPRKLFQRLFRQDLLVASMLRHFLLADRIFRSLGCTPRSIPELPSTWKHRIWDAWDQAVENCLIQLPSLLPPKLLVERGFHRAARIAAERQQASQVSRYIELSDDAEPLTNISHIETRFFRDQLQAFEVWLAQPSSTTSLRQLTGSLTLREPPPEQLPMVLQVLLSQQHRVVALDLLARFLELGPWAISQALSVGIFPYVLKLLQSPVAALKTFLVRIWVRILDLDPSCCDELKKEEKGYFVRQLSATDDPEHVCRVALVLCISCSGDPKFKSSCLRLELDKICYNLIQPEMELNYVKHVQSDAHARQNTSESDDDDSDSDAEGRIVAATEARKIQVVPESPKLRHQSPNPPESTSPLLRHDVDLVRWACLLLSRLWDGYEFGRIRAFSLRINRALETLLLEDEYPQVREAAAYALGRLLGPLYSDNSGSENMADGARPDTAIGNEEAYAQRPRPLEEKQKSPDVCEMECDLAVRLLRAGRQDGSPLVRREILFAISRFVTDSTHLDKFQLTVHFLAEFRQRSNQTQPALIEKLQENFGSRGPKYMAIWLDITRVFAIDPFPAVSQTAQILIRFVKSGVDARIEAIRGRAGEASVTHQSQNKESVSTVPESFLQSDLFERSKRRLCRSKQEVEEESTANEVRADVMQRKLAETESSTNLWMHECSRWLGQSVECSEWWYSAIDGEDHDVALSYGARGPFLQLLRAQQLQVGEGGTYQGASAATSLSVGPVPAISQGGSNDSSLRSNRLFTTEIGIGENGESDSVLIRRLDELPRDIFSVTSARGTLRYAGVTSVLTPAYHTSSSTTVGSSSAPLLSGMSIARRSDPSPVSTHKFEELYRVDFGRLSLGSVSTYAATFHPSAPFVLVGHQQTLLSFDFAANNKNTPILAARYSNLSTTGTRITSGLWLEVHSDPLLLTYADDEHVRVWRDAIKPSAQLVTAFSPFDVVGPATHGSAGSTASELGSQTAPLAEYVALSGHLICTSAFSQAIRVWDLVSEKLVTELVCTGGVGSQSPVVSALSSSSTTSVFASGFTDGTVRVFDRRISGKYASVVVPATVRREPVVSISRLSPNQCMATVTEGGHLKVWDIRMDRAATARTEFKCKDGGVFAFHPNAPILACAPKKVTTTTGVRVIALNDLELSQIKFRAGTSQGFGGFMGSSTKQLKDICNLVWHPNELALGVGTSDSFAVYSASNSHIRGFWTPRGGSQVSSGYFGQPGDSTATLLLPAQVSTSHNSGSLG